MIKKHFSPLTACMARLSIAVLVGTLLAACSHAPPKPDEAKVRQFSGHAYSSDEHYGIATTLATWTAGQSKFDVALTVPDKPGRYPLVIYLPGLGETRIAGNTWRTAWTQAGYAVLAIQLLDEDAQSWSSPKSRTGDFAALARVRYSAKIMSARIEVLESVWRELAQRQARGEAPLDRIDLAHVAVAGYDLGAYTAMIIAGETGKDSPQFSITIPVAAVIALSPYADFSGATFSERYRSIKGPVLSVTSDNDADAIGMVTSPSVRKAPFEYMPSGDKFLMLLWGVPHFVLGGDSVNGEVTAPNGEVAKPDSASDARPPGGPSGPSGPNTPNRPRERLPEPGTRQSDSTTPAATVVSVTDNAIGAEAVAGITTAFLDAYLKNDAVASEWLDKDAPRWLQDKGEIRKK